MAKKIPTDPYAEVIDHFNRKGVRYAVVGMSGINYYAKSVRDTFATMDFDFFVEPLRGNVNKAIRVLKDLKFSIGTSAGALKPEDFKEIVRERKTLIATTPEGLLIELLLQISGYSFSELAKDAATFTVGGIPVRVGKLDKLLYSKLLAGRPKDRQFLKRYQTLLKDEKA